MNCVTIVGEVVRLGLFILCECLCLCVIVSVCMFVFDLNRKITNEQKGGIMTSNCIMSLAVIFSSQLRCDISDGVVLP